MSDRLNFAELEVFGTNGTVISPVGCSTYTNPSYPCSRVYDNDLASFVLLWFTSQNYTWIDVDLGANYDIESLRLTSRAHGGGYIYPGKLTGMDCFRIGSIGRLYESDMSALVGVVRDVLEKMDVALPIKQLTVE